jgi:hypothetical protein
MLLSSKSGVVEYWSSGVMGEKEDFYTSNTPTLHYSNTPSLFSKMTQPWFRLLFVFLACLSRISAF